MAFYFTVYLSLSGSPATGLTPTINVYDLSDDSKVVDGESMSEVAEGLYKYEYSAYDPAKNYVGMADGGNTLAASERYVPCESGINPLGEEIEGGLSLRAVAKLMLSYLMGLASGGGTDNISFRDLANTKDRVKMVVDDKGNRSAVILDGDD